jgi:hypothetical protein
MIAVGGFGLAAMIGVVFAFVGFDTHSLWFDELFTALLLKPTPGTTLLWRIATDVHPPLYLLALAGITGLFGDDEVGLRLLSAFAACSAILVFVLGTRLTFSLPARLFGAAIATGSLFWFSQAQYARSYALCLLIVSGLLAVSLTLLKPDRGHRGPQLVALLGLAVAGSFTHFYALYVSLSVLILLAFIDRRDRALLAGTAAALIIAAGLYVKLVIEPYTRVSLNDNWYQNNIAWYLTVLRSCLDYTLGPLGLAAILLCVAAILHGRLGSANRPPVQLDRVMVFLGGVPVLVLAGAVVSSTLLAPNFWGRNFLIVSPFFWALSALAYDVAMEKAKPVLRLALASALSLLVLTMSSIAMARLPSAARGALYEPFRQSAQWIQSLPACHGQILPAVTTDHPSWYKPGYAEAIYKSAYGHYLRRFAPTELIFSRDLVRGTLAPGLRAELERRLEGEGCPVLAWSVHNMTTETFAWISAQLLASLGRGADDPRVMTQAFSDGTPGFILYVRQSAR